MQKTIQVFDFIVFLQNRTFFAQLDMSPVATPFGRLFQGLIHKVIHSFWG
jgi:hypothetical protein